MRRLIFSLICSSSKAANRPKPTSVGIMSSKIIWRRAVDAIDGLSARPSRQMPCVAARLISRQTGLARSTVDGRAASRGSGAANGDCGFRQLSQGLVSFLLLLQCLIEKTHGLLQTKLLRPCFQRSIPRDLIVLDRLRRSDQAGVKGCRTLELLHDLLAFINHPVDGVAGFALCGMFYELENLLEPLDLIRGLVVVFLKGSLQIFRMGSLRQLRKSGEDFLFGVVDVFQGLVQEVFKHLLFF